MSALEKIKQQTKTMKEKAAKEFQNLPKDYLKKNLPRYPGPKTNDKKKMENMEEDKRVAFFKHILKNKGSMTNEDLENAFNNFADLGDINRRKAINVLMYVLGKKKLFKFMEDVVGGKNSDDLINKMANPEKKVKINPRDPEAGTMKVPGGIKIDPETKEVYISKAGKRANLIKEVMNEAVEEVVFESAIDRMAVNVLTENVTGYDLFATDMKKGIEQDITEINRLWRELSKDQRKQYNDKASKINQTNAENKPAKKKIIYLDSDVIPLRAIQTGDSKTALRPSIDELQCVYDYMKHIWIDDYYATYITSPNDSPLDSKYIISDEKATMIYDDKEWHRPSKYFYMMQCGRFQDDRRQDGIIFTCFDGSLKLPVNFIVGYKTLDNEFVIQDEAIFQKEKKWLARKYMSQYERHAEFINSRIPSENTNIKEEISKRMREYISVLLNYSLSNEDKSNDKKIEPLDSKDTYYTSRTPFVSTVEESIMLRSTDKSIIEYIRNVIEFTSFVDLGIFGSQSKIFRSRLRADFYNPELIPSLTIQQKFPEVFENDNITNKDEYLASINSIIYQKANAVSYYVYNSVFPADTITKIPSITDSIPSLKDVNLEAVNSCDLSPFPSFEIIYYTEDNKRYCFAIYQLYNMFQSGNLINPNTGNKFSDEFVDYVTSFFNSKSLDDEFSKLFEPTVSVLGDIGGMSMIQDLMSKIADIEMKAFASPSSPSSVPSEGDEKIDESIETPSEEIKITDSMVEDELKCELCSQRIDNDQYKTILDDKDPKIVHFCTTKCFSEWTKAE